MYSVSVAPSKIVTKTRRGMNQSVDHLDSSREHAKKISTESSKEAVNSGPRPIFHTSHRKLGSNRLQEIKSPEHEQVVQFLSEYYDEVRKDFDAHEEGNTLGPSTILYYEERSPNRLLEDFKPFDLEAWWGRRLFNNLTKNVS